MGKSVCCPYEVAKDREHDSKQANEWSGRSENDQKQQHIVRTNVRKDDENIPKFDEHLFDRNPCRIYGILEP